jgi:hypothetical protein
LNAHIAIIADPDGRSYQRDSEAKEPADEVDEPAELTTARVLEESIVVRIFASMVFDNVRECIQGSPK